MDIEQTLVEVHRVLRTGGVFVGWDPLAHNPAINVYRRIATDVRTEDEHPLTMSDLKLFRKYFSHFEYSTTWFFTLWILIKFYFIDGIDPNKERYWKEILLVHRTLENLYGKLKKMDNIFLGLFPSMKKYCWNIVVMARK